MFLQALPCQQRAAVKSLNQVHWPILSFVASYNIGFMNRFKNFDDDTCIIIQHQINKNKYYRITNENNLLINNCNEHLYQ